MAKRQYYEIQTITCPDIVNLKQLREMLGGIGKGTALKPMQENRVEHFKLSNVHYIPKDSVTIYRSIITEGIRSCCSTRLRGDICAKYY